MSLLDFFKTFPWNPDKAKPSGLPTIKRNNKDKYYLDILHKQLVSSGSDPKKLSMDMLEDFFGDETYKAVVAFQQTHLGPDNNVLDVDGIVGPDTWWALFNFDGDSQRNFLATSVSPTIENERAKVIKVALKEHSKGSREIPKGSNWGGEVSKYLKFCGIGPNAWCLAFVQWAVFEALKRLPWKRKETRVQTFWDLCLQLNIGFKVNNYSPIPGDLFVIVHKDGTGHIGIISNVNSETKASKLNVVEGNSGDRVALRERIPGQNDHVGYINFYGDSKNRPRFNTDLAQKVSFEELGKTR